MSAARAMDAARRRARALVVVLTVAAAGPVGATEEPPARASGPAPAAGAVTTVAGTIRSVAAKGHAVTLATPGGPLELEVDRATGIYLAGGPGTVRDLAPGASVRAAFGPARRAFWVEVVSPAARTAPEARPAGGARARSGGTLDLPPPRTPTAGPPSAPPPATAAGASPGPTAPVPAGPGDPEPNPGSTPPPPPGPSTGGPGPLPGPGRD
jgi:hypothetical protein